MEDLRAARSAYERALAVDEKIFGTYHTNVARDLNNLGGVLYALEDIPAAKLAYERAVDVCMKVYGPDHANTRTVEKNLAALTKSRNWANRILGRE
jgi:tetratricopeptide (TPR) repeat protein